MSGIYFHALDRSQANPTGAGEIQWSPAVFATNGIAQEHDAEQLVRTAARLRLVPVAQPV